MRILFVCGGGVVYGKEIITLSLLEGLRERGHEVRCLTSKWGNGEFVKRLKESETPYALLPLGFISTKLSWPQVRMTLHQMLNLERLWAGYSRETRAFRPEAIVQTNIHHLLLLSPLTNKRRTVFHVHEPFPETKLYRRLFRRLNQKVRAFVGVSDFIRDSIVRLGVPREKVFTVLNGIEPGCAGLASDKAGESALSEAAGSASSSYLRSPANGAVRIGIIGQIGGWKGHDDFVEALRGLKDANLQFSCSIFGRGDEQYVASLKRKIEGYELADRIRWAGFVQNPEEIFAATDICVVPSRSDDPCPTVAIEAAHFGVPVVATRRGGLPELVQEGKTGYLVDAGRPEQITEKLKLLIEDGSLRQRMAAAARLHGSSHLTRKRMVRELEEILNRVVEHDGAAG